MSKWCATIHHITQPALKQLPLRWLIDCCRDAQANLQRGFTFLLRLPTKIHERKTAIQH